MLFNCHVTSIVHPLIAFDRQQQCVPQCGLHYECEQHSARLARLAPLLCYQPSTAFTGQGQNRAGNEPSLATHRAIHKIQTIRARARLVVCQGLFSLVEISLKCFIFTDVLFLRVAHKKSVFQDRKVTAQHPFKFIFALQGQCCLFTFTFFPRMNTAQVDNMAGSSSLSPYQSQPERLAQQFIGINFHLPSVYQILAIVRRLQMELIHLLAHQTSEKTCISQYLQRKAIAVFSYYRNEVLDTTLPSSSIVT